MLSTSRITTKNGIAKTRPTSPATHQPPMKKKMPNANITDMPMTAPMRTSATYGGTRRSFPVGAFITLVSYLALPRYARRPVRTHGVSVVRLPSEVT